jgi:hypothetical protein
LIAPVPETHDRGTAAASAPTQ